jgi:hypothetical protein
MIVDGLRSDFSEQNVYVSSDSSIFEKCVPCLSQWMLSVLVACVRWGDNVFVTLICMFAFMIATCLKKLLVFGIFCHLLRCGVTQMLVSSECSPATLPPAYVALMCCHTLTC